MASADRRVFRAEASADQNGRASVVIGRWWQVPRPLVGAAAGASEDSAATVAAAFAVVPQDLARLAEGLRARGQLAPAQIVEASIAIAADPDLRERVDRDVAGGVAPAVAMLAAAEHYAGILAALDDPTLAARASDVRAVGQRLAAATAGQAQSIVDGNGSLILAGWEVTADDLLREATALAGAVSVVGGATAHVGIVARSLGIPILFGVDPAVLSVGDGTEVLLDTRVGEVVVDPDDGQRDRARADATAVDARRSRLASARVVPLVTADGEPVTVLANVASAVEADLAVRMEAPGVGLLRTEMPFLTAAHWPTYEEHVAELTAVLRPLTGRPVTVRTLDFADDKLPPFLRARRSGPLGPGLPLLLAEPEAFGAQLRAILRTAHDCDVRVSVMIPMVDTPDTLRQCRSLIVAAAGATGLAVPPVGAMVELAAAVEAIADLATVSDFLSIGTNDLTASLLGLGRRDPALVPARIREPAVRAAIGATARAGRDRQRSVSVCGDAASDPQLVPDLLDLGCRVLSVAPSMLDEIRVSVRSHHG